MDDIDADVIVIGAGMAGLTAAHELHARGLAVLLLEGSDRVGGRVHSHVIEHQGKDITLELGASWIHGINHNPLWNLAQQLQLPTVPTTYKSIIWYKDLRQSLTFWDFLKKKLVNWLFHFELLLTQWFSRKDESIQTVADRVISRYHISGLTLRGFQADLAFMEKFDNTDVGNLSARNYDMAVRYKFHGDEVLFPSGYSQLALHMANGLNIKLNSNVTDVSYKSSGVLVTCGTAKYRADYAICTLPIGVLKSGQPTFSPALPRPKTAALKRIGFGVYHKTYLVFDTVFWDADKQFIIRLPKDGSGDRSWVVFINWQAIFGVPVLLCVNCGRYGLYLESLTDQEVATIALSKLREVYGDEVSTPAQVLTTRWGHNPLAYGAYCYVPQDGNAQPFQTVEAPLEGRLFFAGEGTTEKYFGYVHGAYFSGKDAAKAVLAQVEGRHSF